MGMRFLRTSSKGFTLIEAAVIILLLSIALIPIIRTISNSDGTGMKTSSGTQNLSKEQAIANSIMEKALAGDTTTIYHPLIAKGGTSVDGLVQDGDILSFAVNGDFGYLDTNGDYVSAYTPPNSGYTPGAGNGATDFIYVFPKYKYDNNNEVYYQWVVYDSTIQYNPSTSAYENYMPEGNTLVKAVLRVFTGKNADTKTSADYSVSSYFFKNTTEAVANDDFYDKNIGVILLLDTSISMRLSNYFGGSTFGFDLDDIPATTAVSVYTKVADNPAWNRLPIRLSSGLSGYDPYAVASPYLVYRAGYNDLYFGKPTDNTLTPYDERYNPCFTVESSYAIDIPALPSMSYSDNLGYGSGDLWAESGTNLNGSCTAPTPTLPSDVDIFLEVPTMPHATIQTRITTANPTITAAEWTSGVGSQKTFGDGCLSLPNISTSTCNFYDADYGVLINDTYPNATAVADKSATKTMVASMFGNPYAPEMTKTALSRIESARTAMLAFVETIEQDTDLRDNFRIALVPFATEVQDGTYSLYTTAPVSPPDEVVGLEEPTSGSFDDVKESLFRLNRACNSATHTYDGSMPNCPAGKEVFTLTGQTNIAHALFYAQNMFSSYSTVTLDQKLVILLTDGDPTASATGLAAVQDVTHGPSPNPGTGEAAHLATVANALKADGISIYSVGLMTAGNVNADSCFTAIKNTNSDNVHVNVSSVADLSSVFESIASQAERMLLLAMKDRYPFLQ